MWISACTGKWVNLNKFDLIQVASLSKGDKWSVYACTVQGFELLKSNFESIEEAQLWIDNKMTTLLGQF